MNNEMIKGNKKSKKLYIESLENDVVVRTKQIKRYFVFVSGLKLS